MDLDITVRWEQKGEKYAKEKEKSDNVVSGYAIYNLWNNWYCISKCEEQRNRCSYKSRVAVGSG